MGCQPDQESLKISRNSMLHFLVSTPNRLTKWTHSSEYCWKSHMKQYWMQVYGRGNHENRKPLRPCYRFVNTIERSISHYYRSYLSWPNNATVLALCIRSKELPSLLNWQGKPKVDDYLVSLCCQYRVLIKS